MKTKWIAIVLGVALAACASLDSGPPRAASADGAWALEALVGESCCCDAICPCMVGSPSTRGFCEGTRLIDIRRGRFGDVTMDDVTLLATLRMGEWVRIYVQEEATPAQAEAAASLIAAAYPSFGRWGIESTERVPVTLERTATSLAFASPDAAVEMEIMTGADGEPIRVENLASYPGYVQYRSRVNRHDHATDGSGPASAKHRQEPSCGI